MRLLVMALSAMASVAGLTAKAEIEWLATEYDFGVMKEVLGPQTGQVKGVNRGPDPTYISQVRPSCGCTGASFTEDVLLPGDTATVTFTYNPAGRPGRFEKTVKVFEGRDNVLTTVWIRGTVIGEPASLEADYPVVAGPLRMSRDAVDMGDVRQGTARHAYVKLYNMGETPLTPRVTGGCPGVELELATKQILPGDVGTFSIYLNTIEMTQCGEIDCVYDIAPSADSEQTMQLAVRANVTPDLTALDAKALDKAPQVSVNPGMIDLGDVSGHGTVAWTLSIGNTGKKTLRVAGVNGDNNTVRVKRRPAEVRPGKSDKAEGTVNVGTLPDGPFRLYIDIVTDDPVHPVVRIPVTGVKTTS